MTMPDEAPVPAGHSVPFGAEFSPDQVGDLRALLEGARSCDNETALQSHVQVVNPKYIGTKRAMNVIYGLAAYGLWERPTASLTPLAEMMLAEPQDDQFYAIFAQHILRECHGMAVLQSVSDLLDRGEKAQKVTLGAELNRRGFKLPPDTTNHTTLLNWLKLAGVVSYSQRSFRFDDERVRQLVGMGIRALDQLAGMSQHQRYFLEALQRLAHGTTDDVPARDVRKQVEAVYPTISFAGNMRAKVIVPLEVEGWLESAGGSSAGKSGLVRATQKLLDADLQVVEGFGLGLIPGELRKRLNVPLEQILTDLEDADDNVRGVALEVLALRMAYDVGLTPMGFRLRSAEAGYGEVDLVAEAAHLHFSRWLFQCKAVKGTVQLADLAKEVGMAAVLGAQVVVMVTTGQFSQPVRDMAAKVASNTNLQVVLMDKTILRAYKGGGAAVLLDDLRTQAQRTSDHKRRQVAGIVD